MKRSFSPSRHLSTILILSGVLIILYPLLTEVVGMAVAYRMRSAWATEARRQQIRARQEAIKQIRQLGKDAFRSEDEVLASIAGTRGTGSSTTFPETKIRIPKIGLEQVMVNGTGTEELKNGPGLYRESPLPGARGNVLVAGHRVTYTRPFFYLDELKKGDVIILETLDYVYEYKVALTKVTDPKDVSMLEQTDDARITLTTCTPRYSAKYRLDVQGVLASVKARRAPTLLRRLIRRILDEPTVSTPKNAYQLAIQQARAALDNNPRDPEALTALGLAYRKAGRTYSAQKQFEAAISYEPGYAPAHYNLGLIFARRGEKTRALKEFLQAYQLDRVNSELAFQAGRMLIDMERFEEARPIFEEWVRREPLSAENHYYLGLLDERAGKLREAETHYQEALRFVPDYEDAQKGLVRLGKKLFSAP